ncbi:MAG: SDR family oxidoreductase [Actinobacteria bacterium]|nr:SDR family oxidoreductase [Actinomycetota bacterium]
MTTEGEKGGDASAIGVAVVTGAGGGIGRATALELAARGYCVGLFDLSEEAAEATAEQARWLGGSTLVAVGDVASAIDVDAAVAATAARFGTLDAAVACAGIEMAGSAIKIDPDQWRRAFAVNVDGVLNLARAAIPAMSPGGGAFVAISSDAGVTGWRGCAAYVASKHAVVGLVRALALDHGRHGIRSNVVAPAFVETEMTERIFAGSEELRGDYEALIPMGRFADPTEVARVVAHLISPEAAFTNGHVYMVDGGETAGLHAGRSEPPPSHRSRI